MGRVEGKVIREGRRVSGESREESHRVGKGVNGESRVVVLGEELVGRVERRVIG